MNNYKENIEGSMQKLADAHLIDIEEIKRIGAYFHYLDAKLFEDGSVGTVRITWKQLCDCLAYAWLMGRER